MTEPGTGSSPIIVIGMHRSGTTLLTRALQRAGLFMGVASTRNAEATFTNALNAWLFRQASATWDRPESVDDLLADETVRPQLLDYVGGVVRGPASVRFLGLRRWWRYRGLDRVLEPWGWKDPRTTFTLPLWLQLFPDACVVHIVRHGVPVAESLRVRRERAVAARLERYRRRRRLALANPLAPKRGGFGDQPRCRSLAGGFSLWESYVERARAHVESLGSRGLELRYEDLVASPQSHLRRVLEFSGLPADPARLVESTSGVTSDRANRWRSDPRLSEFAAGVAERLGRLGYSTNDRD